MIAGSPNLARAATALVLFVQVAACRRSEAPPVPKPPDDMVTIPAGPFRAGCDVSQGCTLLEGVPTLPIHDATLPAFEIDRLEVSVADYQTCWRAGYCEVANDRVLAIVAELRAGADRQPGDPDFRPDPMMAGTDPRQPASGVTAYEARVYCAWVGKRLPTALEWEKAARGTDGRAHPWGNEPPTPELTSNAGYYHVGSGFPLPVGSQPAGASPYGVLDMVGNVIELVERDDGDRSRILIAGGHPMLWEEARRGITVLPGIDNARGIYWRHPLDLVGFRCARSLPATPGAPSAR